MSQIMIMYKNHNQTRALNIDGAEQIFLSIIQSPSFIIHDNSAMTVVLVSGAILLFSPYMYIFSLEGATVAYFTSVLAGLDTDALSRQQHCVTGMMINCILSVYLVPSPGSHIAGLLGCFSSVIILPLRTALASSLPHLGLTDLPLLVASLVSLALLGSRGILSRVELVQVSTPEIHWRLFGKQV